ncbi:anthranilate phosphoribosyltransferase [Flavobacterium selenitireducens]|uniref:anthranilate phosphoribosyltransferase n=1 Tax=Flavobacterium selenitireducens TaxID=2722704 RepID=UPI00168B0954|nr:anthranilate phosphoribosyltransferase [Flavobacterium selenitireducens]MBD3583824.1 anthranilate phosphoribosyltransferase [Flavobacterium selenitireducens]
MKTILNRLINHDILSRDEAYETLVSISNGKHNQAQIAAFLTVFMMRPISIDELSGFRQALLDLCVRIDFSDFETIDLCGTGGDGKNTFNISTLASFVVAGCGLKVAKHGNYGVSSISGSSNVMEQLGVKFTNDENALKRCLDQAGICILHAPLFHPAMKNVGPIRKELGIKTFFNLLGPLVNPASPQHQFSGVFSLELARMYAYLLQRTDVNFRVIHDLGGYDEISLTHSAKRISNQGESVISPSDFGLTTIDPIAISGGTTVAKAASIFLDILNGKGSDAQNHVVCANACQAIEMMSGKSPRDAFEMALESLRSGAALTTLKKLQTIIK